MNELQVFRNEAFGEVRTVEWEGEPWFVAADVCKALEINNPTDAIKRLDDDEKARLNLGLPGGATNAVNEPGLYALVGGSRKPEAKAFKRWINHEVIPAIRKHGMYATPETVEKIITDPDFLIAMATALKAERTKVAALTKEVEELAPAAAYCNSILQSKDPVTATAIAKDYGMSAFTFNKMLHDMGIQYRQNGMWLLYQPHANKGYTCSKTFDTGPETCRMHTYWTQRGRYFLYEFLRDEADLLPMIERTGA